MAVDRVDGLLRTVTAALDGAGTDYAVVGGDAVAAWVVRADPSATRSTRDVELLVNRHSLSKIDANMASLGLQRVDLRHIVLYRDPADPSKRSGVHLVWADELAWPSYSCPSPTVDEVIRDPQGCRVLDRPALVRMKLTSSHGIDRVHARDLINVGLITADVRSSLSADLAERLTELQATTEEG
jgi:hypothetical protein